MLAFHRYLGRVCIVATLVTTPGIAFSAPITFFGEDLNNDPDVRIPHPNSDAARALFLSNLTGTGTETFESFAAGTGTPLPISFPGAGTATLTGSGVVLSQPVGTNGTGRYPISGDQYWDTAAGGDFVINFSDPIAALGFYGVDVGDLGGQLELVLTLSGGGTVNVIVPHTVGTDGSTDGSVLYFGFYDTTQTYTSVAFDNPSFEDFFAFDDMTIGSLEQVTPNPVVPEPTSMILLATGIAGAAARRLRKSRRS